VINEYSVYLDGKNDGYWAIAVVDDGPLGTSRWATYLKPSWEWEEVDDVTAPLWALTATDTEVELTDMPPDVVRLLTAKLAELEGTA
jgi:hypothetical protein